MSGIAAVGLQVAAGLLLTYPYEQCTVTYKAHYQPLEGSSAASSPQLTSVWSVFKHHLFSSPQGAFELYRGVVPFAAYTVTYSALFAVWARGFRALVPAPMLGAPSGVAWRDAAPLELYQSLCVGTWRALLSPLAAVVRRALLAPAARALPPILPNPWSLLTATTTVDNKQSPRAAPVFLRGVAALELLGGLVAGAANLVIAQAGLPILTYLAPAHFPSSNRAADIATAGAWALGGVALRLASLAIDTVAIRLSVQDTASPVDASAAQSKTASTITLRPKPYRGIRDAVSTIQREEGAAALVRGWGIAIFLDVFAVTTTLAVAAANLPPVVEQASF